MLRCARLCGLAALPATETTLLGLRLRGVGATSVAGVESTDQHPGRGSALKERREARLHPAAGAGVEATTRAATVPCRLSQP